MGCEKGKAGWHAPQKRLSGNKNRKSRQTPFIGGKRNLRRYVGWRGKGDDQAKKQRQEKGWEERDGEETGMRSSVQCRGQEHGTIKTSIHP